MKSPLKAGYTIHHITDTVSLITENHVADWLRCNIWHVRGKNHDLLIDSGMGVVPLKPEISKLCGNSLKVISTHAHFDHMGGAHEFECHLGHPIDKDIHATPTGYNTLSDNFVTAEAFTCIPYEGFDHTSYQVKPAPLTGYLDEGDVLDTGEHAYRVLHLPGHTPGSICLYEEKSGILFSGDVVYQGGLIDSAWHSNTAVYEESLRRLRELPVSVVHGGHEPSFGRERMKEIIDSFLAGGQRYTMPHHQAKRS